jgi:hypothetical protein
MAVHMKRQFICALSLVCLSLVGISATDSTPPTQYRRVLEAGPVRQLPGKAAEPVKQAKSQDRATTASGVTKAAVIINPAAAPGVARAIAQAVPGVAARATGAAAAEQPKQAAAIAAAVAAAPTETGKIVVAVCHAVPGEYRSVAIAVSQTNPGLAKEVLKAVASAIPKLGTGVEVALSDYSENSVSVASVLDAAVTSKVGTLPLPQETTVRPPFIPISETVRTIPPETSGEVPTGGRESATP